MAFHSVKSQTVKYDKYHTKAPWLNTWSENRPFFQAGKIRQHFRFYFSGNPSFSNNYQNPSNIKKKKKFI